jgi:asparagine synthase (glutamine-hydrolysing)
MNVGFTVFGRSNEAEFHVRNHGHLDRPALVTHAAMPGLRAVLMGRLYYREDQRAGLDVSDFGSWQATLDDNDAALALAVYQQKGIAGLERLEGDFALVLWDACQQRLVGMRDPMGGYPLFWSFQQGVMALSNRMRPLLDLLPGRTLDQAFLAEYLMAPGFYMEEPSDERCVYEGIRRVLAGSIVVCDLPSGKIERRRFWDWLERRVDPGTDQIEELGGQYLDRLRPAVRQRLRGRTASHLSGGMDSTGVALLARDCLQGSGPLHTLSIVYEGLSHLARERPFLESALGQPGLTPHRIAGDDILDFDSFRTAPVHDEPCPWLWRLGMEGALTTEAARAGATTILSGLGADEMLDMQPFHLTDLLRRGRLWAAWSEAARWASARNCSAWKIVGPFGFANLLPAWMRAGLGTWWRGGYAGWRQQNEWTIAPWILPDFARRHGLRDRSLANIRRAFHACRPVGLSLALRGIRENCGDFSRWYVAAPQGIVLTHPFLDPRVLCLGLGIQARVRPQPGAQKPILAAAMRGILPDCIRNRPGKGHFNEVYYVGLSRNLQSLEALIQQAPIDDLGMFDKTALLDCLQRAALGNAADVNSLTRLNSTLCFLKWLTLQHKEQQRHAGASQIAAGPGRQRKTAAAWSAI